MDAQIDDRSFVSKPPDEYVCLICSKVLRDPQLTDCCGQHFCLACLKQWFKEQGFKQCPHCRKKSFTHIVYLPLKRKIDELKVYCSNKENGCELITSLGELEEHTRQCGHAKLECKIKCGCLVLRKDMQDHCESKCVKRLITCTFCFKSGQYDNITGVHKDICPNYPVGCPRKCDSKNSAQIKRKDLSEHKKVCPREVVLCKLCEAPLFRYTLDSHAKSSCPKRLVMCKHCNIFGQHDEINGAHVEKCSEYPVSCPRGCKDGKQLKRKELTSHATTCELEPVKCKFSEAGCREQVVRKDLAKHMELGAQAHLENCLEFQLSMANDYDILVNLFKELKGRFDLLEAEHRQCGKSETASSEIDTKEIHTKKTLLPNLSKENPLLFELHPPIESKVTSPFNTWTSYPFLVGTEYKMVLKLECLRSRSIHPKSRRSKLTDQLTSNLYILEESLRELKAGGDQTTRKSIDLHKGIKIDISNNDSNINCWNVPLCVRCGFPPRLNVRKFIPSPYGDMQIVNTHTVTNQLKEKYGYGELNLSEIKLSLTLVDHCPVCDLI